MSTLDSWKKKVLPLLKKNEKNIIFGLSLVLVAVLAFELGSLTNAKNAGGTLVIEKPAVSLAQIKKDAGMAEEGRVAGAEATSDKQPATGEKQEALKTSCVFVGSKNSTKYHSPSCSYAKRIKPENVVCFKSKEDAEGRGYTAGCIQ